MPATTGTQRSRAMRSRGIICRITCGKAAAPRPAGIGCVTAPEPAPAPGPDHRGRIFVLSDSTQDVVVRDYRSGASGLAVTNLASAPRVSTGSAQGWVLVSADIGVYLVVLAPRPPNILGLRWRRGQRNGRPEQQRHAACRMPGQPESAARWSVRSMPDVDHVTTTSCVPALAAGAPRTSWRRASAVAVPPNRIP